MLRERPEHPVTIGVHGDWGAGKSSVLEMIDVALDGDRAPDTKLPQGSFDLLAIVVVGETPR